MLWNTKKMNWVFNLILIILVFIFIIFDYNYFGKVFKEGFIGKLKNWELIILFTSVLFVTESYKRIEGFEKYIIYWARFFKNPRIFLVFSSLFLGSMPVKGRTIVSAPILSNIARKYNLNNLSAAMIDYVSTHMYYLFFPLSTSLILAITALNVEYLYFVIFFIPAMCILLSIIIFYCKDIDVEKEKEIALEIDDSDGIGILESIKMITPILFLLVCLGLSAIFHIPYIMTGGSLIFVGISLFLLKLKKEQIKEILQKIDYSLIFSLVLILLLSALAKHNKKLSVQISSLLQDSNNIILILLGSYLTGLTIGSSSTSAATVFMFLAPVLSNSPQIYSIGAIAYLAQYAGYVASPAHACCHYAASYFEVPYIQVWWRISLIAFLASIINIIFIMFIL